MFSFRSFIHANRPQSDDELISAYIDGQLDERTRRAFEARIAADAALQRRVEATRTLVQAAREVPAGRAPRNFTLPRNMGVTARAPAQPLRNWWRLGSAVAAAVFVFAVGLDISGVTRAPQGTLQQPAAAPQQGLTTQSETNSASITATGAASFEKASPKVAQATAADSAGNSAPPPQPLAAPTGTPEVAAPSIRSAPVETVTQPVTGGAAATGPQPTATEQGVANSQRASTTGVTSQTYAATPPSESTSTSVPTVVPAPATPTPYTAPQPSQPAAPVTDWLGVVAALAFVLAIVLGIAGWVRR